MKLPDWTIDKGGAENWERWVEAKIRGCRIRANKWVKKTSSGARKPTRSEWRDAIIKALEDSRGTGKYSGFQLSLGNCRTTDWNYPSVDHLKSPVEPQLAIETRLVNDMKTIMSEDEFESLIGHMAAAMKVKVKIRRGWKCRRSFAAAEEPTTEPPLADESKS